MPEKCFPLPQMSAPSASGAPAPQRPATGRVYAPSKLKEGPPHPDPTVESEALALVAPPDCYAPSTGDEPGVLQQRLRHHLDDVVARGELSSLQLETVVYANLSFGKRLRLPEAQEGAAESGPRAGFFLGDGAGVGKGRQLAAVALERWRRGARRILWVSVSNDLKIDAQRDLDDISASDELGQVMPQGSTPLPPGKLKLGDGVLFMTFSLLVSAAKSAKMSRLDAVIHWLGECPEGGLIMLDECHKAKNLLPSGKNREGTHKPSKTALAVVGLQERLPDACVIYASATGASAPEQLGYMSRLGSFEYDAMPDFLRSIASKGTGALELWAMGMKASGAYLCRTLSYEGAEFAISQVPLGKKETEQYDRACEFWALLYSLLFKSRLGFRGAPTKLTDAQKRQLKETQMRYTLFWGAHMRFFRSMLMAGKVEATAAKATAAVADGMSVVIGLQSTGEAVLSRDAAAVGEEMDDFISAPMGVVRQLIEEHFPTCVYLGERFGRGSLPISGDGNPSTGDELDILLHQMHKTVLKWEELKDVDGADGDVEFEMARDVHQIEAEKLAAAERTGALIDLTANVGEEDLAAGAAQRAKDRTTRRAALLAKTAAAAERKAAAKISAAGGSRPSSDFFAEQAEQLPDEDSETDAIMSDDLEDSMSEDELEDGDAGEGKGCSPPPRRTARQATRRRANPGYIELDSDSDFEPQEEVGDDDNDYVAARPAKRRAAAGGRPVAVKVKRERATRAAKAEAERELSDLSDGGGDDSGAEDDDKFEPGEMARLRLARDPRLVEIKSLLLRACEALELPANPLDHLIDLVGGAAKVAEMTGRKNHMVRLANGAVAMQPRAPKGSGGLKGLNLRQRAAFMDGDKQVAIISEAASVGISLHADKRFGSADRRRMHLTLELPWSAQAAIQQFGRSHRSNQTSAPVYDLVITDVGGERRFASSAAKRLQTLGALLKGDRNDLGAGVELADFQVDNRYGRAAVQLLMESVASGKPSNIPGIVVPDGQAERTFFDIAREELTKVDLLTERVDQVFDYAASGGWGRGRGRGVIRNRSRFVHNAKSLTVGRFLNRILGLRIGVQAMVYAYFASCFDACVAYAKLEGKYEGDVDTIAARDIRVLAPFPVKIHTDPESGGATTLMKVEIDRGMSFDEACAELDRLNELSESRGVPTEHNGFWLSERHFGKRKLQRCFLVVERPNKHGYSIESYRTLERMTPSNSARRPVQISSMRENYTLCKDCQEAREAWGYWFEESASYEREPDMRQTMGTRISTRVVTAGAVLPIYKTLTKTILSVSDSELVRDRLERRRRGDLDAEEMNDASDAQADSAVRFGNSAERELFSDKSREAKNVRLCRFTVSSGANAGQRVVGIFVPSPALEKVGDLIDKLEGLPAETEDKFQAEGTTLWASLGIKTPEEREAERKAAEERRRKEKEAAERRMREQQERRERWYKEMEANRKKAAGTGGAGGSAPYGSPYKTLGGMLGGPQVGGVLKPRLGATKKKKSADKKRARQELLALLMSMNDK